MARLNKISRWFIGLAIVAVASLPLYWLGAWFALKHLPGWSEAESFHMKYDEARSWLPGRVRLRNFSLSGHDDNIQFYLRVAEADVTVNLFALARKEFHATRADVTGVTFRMRHNVEDAKANEKRLRAFGPIPGYDEPPVYKPKPEGEATPPDERWKIAMENVTAEVEEVWAIEYRYRGAGTARGGFRLTPGKSLHLAPSEFVWQDGALLVGETPAARRVSGVLHAEIAVDDFARLPGMQFVEGIRTDCTLTLSDGDLSFLEVYSAGTQPIEGRYTSQLRVLMRDGKLEQGTRLEAEFQDVSWTSQGSAKGNSSKQGKNQQGEAVRTSGTLELNAAHEGEDLVLSPWNAKLRRTVLTLDGTPSKPFAVALASGETRLLDAEGSSAVQSTVDVDMEPGDALLEPIVGTLPAKLVDTLTNTPRLKARVAAYLSGKTTRVELLDLDAGDIKAKGVWHRASGPAKSTFNVSTGLVGLELRSSGGQSEWSLTD